MSFPKPPKELLRLIDKQRKDPGSTSPAEQLDLKMFEKTGGKDVGFRDFFKEASLARQQIQPKIQPRRQAPKQDKEPFVDDLSDMYLWEVQDAYESTPYMHDGRIPEGYGQISDAGRQMLEKAEYPLGKGVPVGVNMSKLSPEARDFFQQKMRAQPTAGALAGPAQPEIQGGTPQESEMLQFLDKYKHAQPSKSSPDYAKWEAMTQGSK